jgi:PleD family two-component response regulator
MVSESADNVAASFITDPDNADTSISKETKRIVSTAKLNNVQDRNLKNARSSVVAIEDNLKQIQEAIKTLEVRMNAAAAAQASQAANDLPGNSSSGVSMGQCSCSCGSRKMWGPIFMSEAQCALLCPAGLPCK